MVITGNWSQDSVTYFTLKKNLKNSTVFLSLVGRRKRVSRKSWMKVSVEVRWTVNKEPPLPGLLWERKGKTKEMLKTKVMRWGSMKRAGISSVTEAICKRVYRWCWSQALGDYVQMLILTAWVSSWVPRGVEGRAGILRPLQLTLVSSASTLLPSDQFLHSAPLQGDRQNKVLENVWKSSWEFGVFKNSGNVCRGVRKVVPAARLT